MPYGPGEDDVMRVTASPKLPAAIRFAFLVTAACLGWFLADAGLRYLVVL